MIRSRLLGIKCRLQLGKLARRSRRRSRRWWDWWMTSSWIGGYSLYVMCPCVFLLERKWTYSLFVLYYTQHFLLWRFRGYFMGDRL